MAVFRSVLAALVLLRGLLNRAIVGRLTTRSARLLRLVGLLIGIFGASAFASACKSDRCNGPCTESDGQGQLDAASPASDATRANEPGASRPDPSLFSCRNDVDCVATPYHACSIQLRHCVDCTYDDHCPVNKPHCAPGISDERNRCVECQSGSECGSGLCRDDACLPCDPKTNKGCTDAFCVAAQDGIKCVECVQDADCAPGVCINHQCRTCNIDSNNGCVGGLYCLPRTMLSSVTESSDAGDGGKPPSPQEPDDLAGVCVECADSKPCANPSLPRCLNNSCVACDPEATDNNGCSKATPLCIVGAVDEDSVSPNRCVECVQSSDCTAAECVNHSCRPCDPDTDAGCPDGQVCIPRTDTAVNEIVFMCVECTPSHACQQGLHCGNDNLCHECTDSSHCGASAPYCWPDGTCGMCTQDEHCTSPDRGSICSAAGLCVECRNDEHCVGAEGGAACATARGDCVECTQTNIDACNGKSCRLLSPNEYTCYPNEDTSTADDGVFSECQRCGDDGSCDAATECVRLNEAEFRCLPTPSATEGRTDCVMQDAVALDGETRSYCVPLGC
jgi:hypothetical protein